MKLLHRVNLDVHMNIFNVDRTLAGGRGEGRRSYVKMSESKIKMASLRENLINVYINGNLVLH